MKITKEATALIVVAVGVAIVCVVAIAKPIITLISVGAVVAVGVGYIMYKRNKGK